MKKFLTALTTAGVLTAVVLAPATVMADEGTKEVTECTTGAYGQQTCVTKTVKCTTGAYGSQNCTTVETKDERVLGEKKHTPVDSGIAENIMFAVAGLTVLSGASLAYSRK